MMQKRIRQVLPRFLYCIFFRIFSTIYAQSERIIHIIDEGVSPDNARYESWTALNPDYTIRIWGENDCSKLISSSSAYVRDAFLKLTPFEKKFFLSYLIVYNHGGVYSHAGGECVESVSNWIDESENYEIDFFGGMITDVMPEEKIALGRSRLREVSTKTFGGKPFNDCLDCVINKIIERSRSADIMPFRPWSEAESREFTGGGVLTDCVFEIGNFRTTRVMNSSWIANNGVMLFGSNAFSFLIQSTQHFEQVPWLETSSSVMKDELYSDFMHKNDIARHRIFVYHEKIDMPFYADVVFTRDRYVDVEPVTAKYVSDEWLEALALSKYSTSQKVEFVSQPLLWHMGWHVALWFLLCPHVFYAYSKSVLIASCFLIMYTLEFRAHKPSILIIFISSMASIPNKKIFNPILYAQSMRVRKIMTSTWRISPRTSFVVIFLLRVVLLCLCAASIDKLMWEDTNHSISEQCDCYTCTFPFAMGNVGGRNTSESMYLGGKMGKNNAAFKGGIIHDVGHSVRELTIIFENVGSNIWLPELDYRVGLVGKSPYIEGISTRLALPGKTLPGEYAILKFTVDMSDFCKQGPRYMVLKWRLLIEYVSWFGDESHGFRVSCNTHQSVVAHVPNSSWTNYIFRFSLALLAVQTFVFAYTFQGVLLGERVRSNSPHRFHTLLQAMTLISIISHHSLFAQVLAVTRLAAQMINVSGKGPKYLLGMAALIHSIVAGEALLEFDAFGQHLFQKLCPLNGQSFTTVHEVEKEHDIEKENFGASFIRLEAVKLAHPGQEVRFHILLENSGEQPWMASESIYLVPISAPGGLPLQVPPRIELPVPIVPRGARAPFSFDTTLNAACMQGEKYLSQYRMAKFRPGETKPYFFGPPSRIHKIECFAHMRAQFEFIDIRSELGQVHRWTSTNKSKENDILVKAHSGLPFLITTLVRNTGNVAWRKESRFSLGMKCCATKNMNYYKIERTEMQRNPIFPGELSTFLPEIGVECVEGETVAYQWQMLQEHVAWFGELSPWIYVECVDPRNDALVHVLSTIPPHVDASSAIAHRVQLVVQNTGQRDWEFGSVKLGLKGEAGKRLKIYDIPTPNFPVKSQSNILLDVDLSFPLSKCGGRELVVLSWQMLDGYGAWLGKGSSNVSFYCSLSCSTSTQTISGSFFMANHRDILDNFLDNTKMMPRIIHQSWKVRQCTYEQSKVISSWIRYHPDWIHVLWTDDELDALVINFRSDLVQVYFDFPKDIYRLDMSRYILMHEFGGVYADLDVEALKSLEPLRLKTSAFVGTESDVHSLFLYGKKRTICNAIIGSRPKHPFWNFFIAQISAMNYEKSLSTNPVLVTGPRALDDALVSFLEIAEEYDHVDVFPDYYFMPHVASYRRKEFQETCEIMRTSFSNQTNKFCSELKANNWVGDEISNETYTIHHWKCTWCS